MSIVPDRVLELTVGTCGTLGMLLAQVPNTDFAEQVAKMSPTALMAVAMYVLWNRYTRREDGATAREAEVMKLTREAVSVMQEVRDAIRKNTAGQP